MNMKLQQTGLKPIRHDRLLQEQLHDYTKPKERYLTQRLPAVWCCLIMATGSG